ncbi:MAG: hypothetical protein ACR652_22465 [Methylocystis sp.]|uniref:hypothetical protein n=1 Tax=Methylocystis sp. TaxID=1911079 RepID=UPI003DA27F89
MTVSVKPNPNIAGKAAEPFPELSPTGLQLTREQLEFAGRGPLSEVFGPLFRQQDSYERVCRMPCPPLLLADRVTGLAGQPGSMGQGVIWTETDVKADAWYLHNGRMPPGVTIEAGQADLMLISWLGVDFHNRSERVYRLLGCELTFHTSYLPKVGDTIRYQIHIDGHAQIGGTRLFFFRYDSRVGDQLLSSVRNGQAGFFADAELAASAGVLWTAEDDRPKADAQLDAPPRLTKKRRFSTAEIEAFAQGDAYACFGEGFEMAAPHTRTPTIGKGRMRLFDRVVDFDPHGGPWGRGYLRAEYDAPVDAWFYAGHFHNDPCMPGTLMAEAAAQALEFYMAALGFTIDRDGWIFAPVAAEAYKFICRGQVTPDRAHLITYEVFIEEIIAGERPTIHAALLARSDGHKVFLARRFGVRLVPDWPLNEQRLLAPSVAPKRIVSPTGDVPGDFESLLATATGKPSDAFGALYRPFDEGLRVARLPSPPYHFMSEVVCVDCPPGLPTPGGKVVVEYRPPADAWYFRDGGNGEMPFAVLMETVLQPCGWLASYMGFSKASVSFRNLDGSRATIHQPVTAHTGALRTTVTFERYAAAGPTTIVFFSLVCECSSGRVMTLETSFGYFSSDALANQKGLPVSPAHRARLEAPSEISDQLDSASQLRREGRPSLPGGRFNLIDGVTGFWPRGGAAGLGAIRGRQKIDPRAWYFKAHFFQDPVQPGSIGLENLISLAKAAALLLELDTGVANPVFVAPAREHAFLWKFRGQVLPTSREVTSEVEIRSVTVDSGVVTLVVDGDLWVDGVRIYELRDLALQIRSGARNLGGPTGRREKSVDIEAQPWLSGHCPTYGAPAFPLLGVVGALATTARAGGPRKKLTALSNLELYRWMRLDQGPIALCFETLRIDGDNLWTDIRLDMDEGGGPQKLRVGRVIETYAEDYLPAPALWPGPIGGAPFDPYEQGGLFHTEAFMRAEGFIRDSTCSAYDVDVESALDAAQGDISLLLDSTAHGVPYGTLAVWFAVPQSGVCSLPRRIDTLQFYASLPASGRLRVVTRALDMQSARTPRCEIQVQHDGRVLFQYLLATALLPAFGASMAAEHWRDFLLRGRWAPGGHCAEIEANRTRFSIERLKALNWFPGTLERLYGASGDPGAIVEAVAVKDHFAHKFKVHPSRVEIGGQTVRVADQALSLHDLVARRWITADIFEIADR